MTAVTAFARDPGTAVYYDRRAEEYDEWYEGRGRYAGPDRWPGLMAEVDRVIELVGALPPARTLDVACGTGFLTRHLRGFVVGLDRSRAMLTLAMRRLPGQVTLLADALRLPFADSAFDRVFTGHFYCHLPTDERRAFLAEVRRVGTELVVIDTPSRPGVQAEEWQDRVLNDGSRHRIYKRYLTAEQLAGEIGGQVMFAGTWFVAVRAM